MTIITRRAALGGLALLPASTAAMPREPEYAIDRVQRLAEALADAMDDWMEEMQVPGCERPHWYARVHPASQTAFPIGYMNARAHAETAQQRLHRTRQELIEASKAAYPEGSDWRWLTPEDGGVAGLFMLCWSVAS